jgi:hypothetical protein
MVKMPPDISTIYRDALLVNALGVPQAGTNGPAERGAAAQ